MTKKTLDAMEKIMMYDFDPFDYYMLNCQLGHDSITIGDIVDSNLSDEMTNVYEALERLELFEQYWKLLGDTKASLKDDFLEKLHEIRSKIDGDGI